MEATKRALALRIAVSQTIQMAEENSVNVSKLPISETACGTKMKEAAEVVLV